MTTPEPRTGTVYALPPEPPVGTTVKFLGIEADMLSEQFTRVPFGEYSVWQDADRCYRLHWGALLDLAGPSGVRVVEGGEGQ